MIMGVAAGAYVAGLFHLMTHAFFKALLFMAAGSVIAAMAGEQNLDKMGGFRKAMPFTFGCFVDRRPGARGHPAVLGLLLQGRDPRLVGERGGWHWILYVVGYIGAFLTAIYTWRMIFRAFWGDPVPEARELEARPPAPRRGAPQPGDRRGGGHRGRLPRPGPPHRRARAADEGRDGRPRGARDGRRRRCRSRSGSTSARQVPRADVRGLEVLRLVAPSDGSPRSGWSSARRSGSPASRSPTASGCSSPGTAGAIRERFAGPYTLFVNKWYFDELIDAVVVRPCRVVRPLRPADLRARRSSTARSSAARPGSSAPARAAVRAIQSGFLRAYAALLLLGLAAVALYFLIQAS